MIEMQATGAGDESGVAVRTVASLSVAHVAGIELLAHSLGFAVHRIDLAGCSDKAGLLERTAAALRFPDWFGHNWDAWFDCLTDLSWQRPAPGIVLVFNAASELQQTMPEVLDTAVTVLEDAARVWAGRNVTLRVFIGLEGNA